MNDLTGALCVGKGELFTCTDQLAHREAAAICAECPVIVACRRYAQDCASDTGITATYGIQGTWGGQLFGSAGRKHRSTRGVDDGLPTHLETSYKGVIHGKIRGLERAARTGSAQTPQPGPDPCPALPERRLSAS